MNAPARLTAALLAAATTAGAASAASVDLTGPDSAWNKELGVAFDDGTEARVSAGSTRWSHGKAWLGQWDRGLGVWNGRGDDHRVDGLGSTDTVWFDFESAFRLTGVGLTYVSDVRPETLRVLDGSGATLGDFDALATTGTDTAFLDLSLLGDAGHERFGLSAVGGHSAFKIEGLQGVSVVPTPTAAAAGVALLIGGALRRRRRDAAA